MEFIRIGNKLISRSRIARRIDEILQMRVAGRSQQETADALGVDRTFISRLEALGEVRKGSRIALVAFSVKNKAELEQAALAEGVDFTLIFTESERRHFAAQRSGADLVNEIMQLTAELRAYDTVLFIGSDMRIEMVEAILGKERVVGIQIGRSPITADVEVDVGYVVDVVRSLKADVKG
mgnify:CR=1 FL=1